MGLLYKCTGGGAGGYTHTHTKVWINPISLKTNTETLITGKIAHFLFFFFSSQKERKGENRCKVSQQKMRPVLGGHMETVHFALQSWERLGTTDVI